MNTRLFLWGLVCGLLTLLAVGCDDDDKPCATCPETNPAVVAALDYIDSHRAELGLRDEVDQMIPYRVQEDDLGMTHVRCYQYYKGVRVEGGELIVHLSATLEVRSISDGIIRDVLVDVKPNVSALQAARFAQDHFWIDGYRTRLEGAIEKVVFRWLDIDHLCWVMVFHATDGIEIREYFVDAHSCEIVYWRSLIITK